MQRPPTLAPLLLLALAATRPAALPQALPAPGLEPPSWSLGLTADVPTTLLGAEGETPWDLELDLVPALCWEPLPEGGPILRRFSASGICECRPQWPGPRRSGTSWSRSAPVRWGCS